MERTYIYGLALFSRWSAHSKEKKILSSTSLSELQRLILFVPKSY